MRIGHLLVYVAAVLTISVGVDVAARLIDRSPQPPTKPAPAVEHTAEPRRASRQSCATLFEKVREASLELALKTKGKNPSRKTRRKITREVHERWNAAKEGMIAQCVELPETDVHCMLESKDAAAWPACGPSIARLISP